MDTITTAPRSVIEQLDAWVEVVEKDYSIASLMEDLRDLNYGFDAVIYDFLWAEGRSNIEDVPYEMAVIEHVFGDVRLEEEE